MIADTESNDTGASASLRTETEKKVASIWEEILQRPVTRSQDNFFDLGGDSMMMMMVLFRVGEDFGVELPQGVLVDAPSVAEFCQLIELRRVEGG